MLGPLFSKNLQILFIILSYFRQRRSQYRYFKPAFFREFMVGAIMLSEYIGLCFIHKSVFRDVIYCLSLPFIQSSFWNVDLSCHQCFANEADLFNHTVFTINTHKRTPTHQSRVELMRVTFLFVGSLLCGGVYLVCVCVCVCLWDICWLASCSARLH